jgi:hypothetical protein
LPRSIGIVTTLGQRVADPVAGEAKRDRHLEECWTGPDDLCPGQMSSGPSQPLLAPGCSPEPELELADRLKRNHEPSTGEQRLVELDERPGRANEVSSEDVRVDHDGRGPR